MGDRPQPLGLGTADHRSQETLIIEVDGDSTASFDERFVGKTFVLTGKLEQFTRDEAGKLIERAAAPRPSNLTIFLFKSKKTVGHVF